MVFKNDSDHETQLQDLIEKEVKRQLERSAKADRQVPYQPWMATWCRYLVRHGGNARSAWRHYRAEEPGAPSRHTLYVHRKRCPRFAEEWAQALKEATKSAGQAEDSPEPPGHPLDPPAGRPPFHDPYALADYW